MHLSNCLKTTNQCVQQLPISCNFGQTVLSQCIAFNRLPLKRNTNSKPLSHQTAMPQRLYSVLKPCQRAVVSPRNKPKISNLSVIVCTQRPHSVPTASTQRSHSVFTTSMTFSQRARSCCSVFTARTRRAHGALTAFSRRAHSDLTAIIAFKMFYYFYLILSNPFLQT